MIHHLSIAAREPQACCRDLRRVDGRHGGAVSAQSGQLVRPAARRARLGRRGLSRRHRAAAGRRRGGDFVKNAEARGFGPTHFALSVTTDPRLSKRSQTRRLAVLHCNRGPFHVIEVWLENKSMVEILPPEYAAEYLACTKPAEIASRMAAAPARPSGVEPHGLNQGAPAPPDTGTCRIDCCCVLRAQEGWSEHLRVVQDVRPHDSDLARHSHHGRHRPGRRHAVAEKRGRRARHGRRRHVGLYDRPVNRKSVDPRDRDPRCRVMATSVLLVVLHNRGARRCRSSTRAPRHAACRGPAVPLAPTAPAAAKPAAGRARRAQRAARPLTGPGGRFSADDPGPAIRVACDIRPHLPI